MNIAYKTYADAARKAEQQKRYKAAAEEWANALRNAHNPKDQAWCDYRIKRCEKAHIYQMREKEFEEKVNANRHI